MANSQDNLTIGGFKDLSLTTQGVPGDGNSAYNQVNIPNSDYQNNRTTNVYNQTQFLSILAQRTTTSFDSRVFDNALGETSGLNPFFKPSPEQGNKLNTYS